MSHHPLVLGGRSVQHLVDVVAARLVDLRDHHSEVMKVVWSRSYRTAAARYGLPEFTKAMRGKPLTVVRVGRGDIEDQPPGRTTFT